ncbi:MAG: hypothetical protein P8O87_09835 [Crocinitomicaceae bacterium]|nr:hypothetical protein [Crocinitomicaceae bacterium]
MTNEEMEFVRLELEKCLRKEELNFEFKRTINEKEYSKRIHVNVNENPLDLMKIIKRRERLLKDGTCNIVLDKQRFDFTSDQLQEIWYSTYEKVDEDLFVEQRLREDGLL